MIDGALDGQPGTHGDGATRRDGHPLAPLPHGHAANVSLRIAGFTRNRKWRESMSVDSTNNRVIHNLTELCAFFGADQILPRRKPLALAMG